MALPSVKSLSDCTDPSKTVLPYISEIYELPQQILQTISSPQGLKELYVSTNPLTTAIALSLFLFPVFWIVSEANKNYSQVDRCWSILPTIYNHHYALWARLAGLPHERLDLLALVSLMWSCRLTYNYWRKGGYKIGSEDYRWKVLVDYIGPVGMFLFNIIFISFTQSILLLSITFPTYAILLTSKVTGDGISTGDWSAAQAMVSLIMLAAHADQQQWNFHGAKNSYRETAKVPAGFFQEDLDRGFNTRGLFSYSRHPNFAAEQSFWVGLYAWSCYVTQTHYNWTGVGAVAYLCLFQASTWFTELITSRKYPEYKEYQKRVSKFIPPRLGFSLPGDFNDKRDGGSEAKKTK